VTNAQVAPPSIARTRDSLKDDAGAVFPLLAGEAPLQYTDLVPGSPFPYQSVTPTCK